MKLLVRRYVLCTACVHPFPFCLFVSLRYLFSKQEKKEGELLCQSVYILRDDSVLNCCCLSLTGRRLGGLKQLKSESEMEKKSLWHLKHVLLLLFAARTEKGCLDTLRNVTKKNQQMVSEGEWVESTQQTVNKKGSNGHEGRERRDEQTWEGVILCIRLSVRGYR